MCCAITVELENQYLPSGHPRGAKQLWGTAEQWKGTRARGTKNQCRAGSSWNTVWQAMKVLTAAENISSPQHLLNQTIKCQVGLMVFYESFLCCPSFSSLTTKKIPQEKKKPFRGLNIIPA
ncbi:hypothetical protein Y1Q_0009807 [Alligator mississippiensis]|uniref:Uncharacterized protein n=1 Tax=Alligator mississippiensis TaxID=8496 RepID=A0A151MWY5_ALLMI|nr:hypothetical protein Y1Q_0009807 [Alligator mississippiensis]